MKVLKHYLEIGRLSQQLNERPNAYVISYCGAVMKLVLK